MRRIPSAVMLTLLLIGTLTLALNITPVNAEIYLYNIVFIEPKEMQVHVGENLLVVVGFGYGFEVDPHPPIVEFSLSYDPNLLDIVHWISGWWDLTVIVEDDHMRVMVSEPPYSTDLMLITFEAKAEGDTILDLFDSNIYTSDGFVTILPAEHSTWTVDDDGPADFSSIQEAINSPHVKDEDTIYVHNGTYYENVDVYKQLNITGAGFEVTIVEFDASGPHNPIFYVTADYVTISGFTITSPTKGTGIRVRDANHVTVTNNRLLGLSYGVDVQGSGDHINISSNKLAENAYGILFSQTGVRYSYSTVANNDIVSYGQWTNEGITVNELFRSTINNNTISLGQNNYGGIWLAESSSYNLVEGNVIEGATYGIRLSTVNNRAPNNNTIRNNTVKSDSHGIRIDVFFDDPNKPSNNTLYHNNIINNTVQAYDIGVNAWDDGYPSGGNYWSDYAGVDLYSGPYQNETGSDGIGDTPYAIDENNVDKYPLMNPWTPTPSVVTAIIDIDPDALNLRSRGKWITAYIELPEGYNVSDINVSTILLNDTIPAEMHPVGIGDEDGDGIPDLMVKFNRAQVTEYIKANVNMTKLYEERFMTITLTITGYLNDGTPFQGSDTVKIISWMPRGGPGRHTFHI